MPLQYNTQGVRGYGNIKNPFAGLQAAIGQGSVLGNLGTQMNAREAQENADALKAQQLAVENKRADVRLGLAQAADTRAKDALAKKAADEKARIDLFNTAPTVGTPEIFNTATGTFSKDVTKEGTGSSASQQKAAKDLGELFTEAYKPVEAARLKEYQSAISSGSTEEWANKLANLEADRVSKETGYDVLGSKVSQGHIDDITKPSLEQTRDFLTNKALKEGADQNTLAAIKSTFSDKINSRNAGQVATTKADTQRITKVYDANTNLNRAMTSVAKKVYDGSGATSSKRKFTLPKADFLKEIASDYNNKGIDDSEDNAINLVTAAALVGLDDNTQRSLLATANTRGFWTPTDDVHDTSKVPSNVMKVYEKLQKGVTVDQLEKEGLIRSTGPATDDLKASVAGIKTRQAELDEAYKADLKTVGTINDPLKSTVEALRKEVQGAISAPNLSNRPSALREASNANRLDLLNTSKTVTPTGSNDILERLIRGDTTVTSGDVTNGSKPTNRFGSPTLADVLGQNYNRLPGSDTVTVADTEGTTVDVNASVVDHIRSREGFKDSVYEDTEGNLTVGAGHKLSLAESRRFPLGTVIPKAQTDKWLSADLATATKASEKVVTDLGLNDPALVDVLTPAAFQLGGEGLANFTKALEAVKGAANSKSKKDKVAAITKFKKEFKDSTWNTQTPVRVDDLNSRLENYFLNLKTR
jgi:GH24 family phage-related lysozyme (muramidase)